MPFWYTILSMIKCFIYWKEKETHILTFNASDLLWVLILSCWQQFISTYTDNKISQQISLISKILKHHPRGLPGITYKNVQHQMQLHQHCMFCVPWIAIALTLFKQCLICIQTFLMSIWRMQMSNRTQHHRQTHKYKTYTEHSFRVPHCYSHSVIFNIFLIIQNQGIWKFSFFSFV